MPIETLIYAKQEGYYKALNASNSTGESTIFVVFMLEIIRDALKSSVTSWAGFSIDCQNDCFYNRTD